MSNNKNYLDELNGVQRLAAEHINGPVLVIAGPGSGKTRVLTYRIANMIDSGIAPWEILSLTFTNKSAKEMKERIVKVVGERANRIWAGTFHSIFARILRSESERLGFPSSFTIYDGSDSQGVIRTIVKTLGLDEKLYVASQVHSRISLAKNKLITPEQYKRNIDLLKQDSQAKKPEIYKIYEAYIAQCKRNGAMDFDDLLYQTHRLLSEFPDAAEKYRKRFKYLLIDEFQDTNALQSSIVKLLVKYPGSPENLCVVGDDAQSIYAFRGATIQNIFDFEKEYPNLKIYKLEQNYRSTGHIVQAANEVIANNRKQLQKTIFTDKGTGDPIKVVKVMTDEEEGRRVMDIIFEQKMRNHYTNSDFAILYRTNSQSRIFEEVLANHRVNYRVYGGMSFYQRKEIKDYVAYLRVAVNPADEEALKRIINYPKRGIGDATVEKLVQSAAHAQISFWTVLQNIDKIPGMTTRAVKPIQEFVALVLDMNKEAVKQDPHSFAMYVGRKSGILQELKADTTMEGIGRFENVTSLLDGIKSFVDDDELKIENIDGQLQDKTLAVYLQNITLLTDADNDTGNEDCVKLMSVHAAKGLEFKAVFVVGMEENMFPSFMALNDNDLNAIDEERRLFYVAITRAQEFLALLHSGSRYRFGKMTYNQPSRFLEEISQKNIDAPTARPRSGVTGISTSNNPANIRNYGNLRQPQASIQTNNTNFVASPPDSIVIGARVLHERFGEGEVMGMDGPKENRVLTIMFDHPSAGEKRIMLKFAKLMVI